MNLQGFYTNRGRALAAKIAAGTAEMTVTRIVAGSGHTDDIPSATDLSAQQQTLHTGIPAISGYTATLPATLPEAEATSSYHLTELGVYASDPDAGEILFQVYQLDAAEAITAHGEGVLRFYLRQSIGAEGVTVTCSPAGVVLEEDIAELRARDAFADHRNLLDNPWFTVNQRGQNSYTGNGYTVDRWFNPRSNATTSVVTGGVNLTSESYFELTQVMEQSTGASLIGKTVTGSFELSNGQIYSGSMMLSYGDFNLCVADGIDCRFNVVASADRMKIRIIGSGNVTVRAIKLELGSVSTLANDVAPNYAQELAKCQRYFRRYHLVIPRFIKTTDTAARMNIVFDNEMRIAPSFAEVSCYLVRGDNNEGAYGNFVDHNAQLAGSSKHNAVIGFNNITNPSTTTYYIGNNDGVNFDFSADL